MSRNDRLEIVKGKDGRFRAYKVDMNTDEPAQFFPVQFVADTIEEAILMAQDEPTEYGYRFIGPEWRKTRRMRG